MNKFAFEDAVMKNITVRDKFVTATIVDRRPVTQADGTVKSVFTCARNVTIFDETIVKFVKDNMTLTSETEFMVSISGYLSSTSKKDKWFDNQIVTELLLHN